MAIADVIQSSCNCDFTHDLISNGQFVCDSNFVSDALFYGYIYQTSSISPNELLDDFTQWAMSQDSGFSLVINGARLQVKSSCQVNSSYETGCPQIFIKDESSNGGVSQLMIYIIAGSTTGLLIILVCVCTMIIVVFMFHRKAKER